MKKLIVLDIVGLTSNALNLHPLPNIAKLFPDGCLPMRPSFPAVTCTMQATFTSGHHPSEHGIIANGYYNRISKEVSFWEQSSGLVEKPRIWNLLKHSNPNLRTAILFWQNSLYADSDIIITPKPIHLENKTIMWCYSKPVGYYEEVASSLGEFDLSSYWGPFASIKSSKWIIDATIHTIKKHSPDLTMVYLPHLDYAAQKFGPNSNEFSASLVELDKLIGDLIDELSSLNLLGQIEIMLISEYGFFQVKRSVSPNIVLKNNGFLSTRIIGGKEYLDFEYSKAFAMVDHQIAHVFVKPGSEDDVFRIFRNADGIDKILTKKDQTYLNINHEKSGEFVLCANSNSWFNYYWWDDVKYAPPFAFSVDIHRKPGYDPLELFLEPKTKSISQDTSLIKGSHGIISDKVEELPVMAMNHCPKHEEIDATQIAPTISKFFGISLNFPSNAIF